MRSIAIASSYSLRRTYRYPAALQWLRSPWDSRGEFSLLTFKVLLHHRGFAAPSLHLVSAVNAVMAQEIADELLDDTPDCIGVEVWDGEQRLYARRSAEGGA